MRTAIFVYESTDLNISTCESDLELCGMNADAISLSTGDNVRTLAPGIYKIMSSQEVAVIGNKSAFEVVVTTFNKDNDPRLFPPRVTETFPSLDLSAMQAFMAVPEAKAALNP